MHLRTGIVALTVALVVASLACAGIIDDVLNDDPGYGWPSNSPPPNTAYTPPNAPPSGQHSSDWAKLLLPAATPCQFNVQLVGDWTLKSDEDAAAGSDSSFTTTVKSVAIEIQGFGLATDGTAVDGDEPQGYSSVGTTLSRIVITKNSTSCSATYTAEFYPEWRAHTFGSGNVEGEVDGLMYGQMIDYTFDDPDAAGNWTVAAGSRGGTEVGSTTVGGQVGYGGVQVNTQVTTTKFASAVPSDERVYRAINTPKPAIAFNGDTVTMLSYIKVRVYADGPSTTDDSEEGAIAVDVGQADPVLTVYLNCSGSPQCDAATKLEYKD